MKKFLLCMMLAGLMMPVVAQEKLPYEVKKVHASEMMSDLGLSDYGMLPITPKGSFLVVEGWKDVGTSNGYDRQTQGSIYPMAQMHDDGFIGVTWTNEDNPPFQGSSTPRRGVAYAFSTDGGVTWSEPDMRVGGIPVYWASYAQWGINGEAILARSADSYMHGDIQILNGLVLMTRKNKGKGEWKLSPVPYPVETPMDDGWVMAWSRMTTSGENHQYIHIMTHTRLGETGTTYEGYATPIFYYRTADGGDTWDTPRLVPDEAVGEVWDKDPDDATFTDAISIAAHGDVVACSFIRMGYHSYILKSTDNGDTWSATKFFHADARYSGDPSEYADTCYVPTLGTVAVDNNGKVHVAFGNRMIINAADEGYISIYHGPFTSFLSYWNEDMDLLDGDDFLRGDMEDLMFEHFIDEDLSDWAEYILYLKSTTPVWPIIGFYVAEGNYFAAPQVEDFDWIQTSYGRAGTFSFPQIAFDANNDVHLVYLGIVDGNANGQDNNRWKRHPYYTSRNADGTWTPTQLLVNWVEVIDQEFAYLTLAGAYENLIHMMVQVDQFAGTYQPYSGESADHGPGKNTFYAFNLKFDDENTFPPTVPPQAIKEVSTIAMNIIPNPASGQATVNFEGKGNITVYNMLGQTVYHVENVENTKTISLNNMATGVYFVTVRSGNAAATQKLIVK